MIAYSSFVIHFKLGTVRCFTRNKNKKTIFSQNCAYVMYECPPPSQHVGTYLDDKYAKIESTTTREYYRVISPTKAVLEIGASASLHTKPTGAFSRDFVRKRSFKTLLDTN
jgi:hypothetical protein